MTRSRPDGSDSPASDPHAAALLVCLPPSDVGPLCPELFTCVESAREALAAMKLLQFRWLLANLDIPDMRPWELFRRVRRAQSKIQCALIDQRITADQERQIRQVGAAAFSIRDPLLLSALTRGAAWRGRLVDAAAVSARSSGDSPALNQAARAPP